MSKFKPFLFICFLNFCYICVMWDELTPWKILHHANGKKDSSPCQCCYQVYDIQRGRGKIRWKREGPRIGEKGEKNTRRRVMTRRLGLGTPGLKCGQIRDTWDVLLWSGTKVSWAIPYDPMFWEGNLTVFLREPKPYPASASKQGAFSLTHIICTAQGSHDNLQRKIQVQIHTEPYFFINLKLLL